MPFWRVVTSGSKRRARIDGLTPGDFAAYYWAYVDGCAESRTSVDPSPCQSHDACPSGKSVVMCMIPGLGHAMWPSAITSEWAFFKSFT